MLRGIMIVALLGLSACGNDFEPVEKTADVDPTTGEVVLPGPCPDWSHSSVINYDNSNHSNYGCAVNNNLAVQLVDPWDLREGIGSNSGNTDMSIRTIELYRAGEIPQPLQPIQTVGTGGS